jgi:uncharacterized cupredoxin-like copper-binding protein
MRARTITAALVGAALVAAVPATAATTHHAAKTTTVTVAMSEFKFKLSKPSAPKGTVVFKVSNKGSVPHDFKINGKKTALLKPGTTATLSVTFTKTGTFAYLCTVPGHAASGMKGKFTVKP